MSRSMLIVSFRSQSRTRFYIIAPDLTVPVPAHEMSRYMIGSPFVTRRCLYTYYDGINKYLKRSDSLRYCSVTVPYFRNLIIFFNMNFKAFIYTPIHLT